MPEAMVANEAARIGRRDRTSSSFFKESRQQKLTLLSARGRVFFSGVLFAAAYSEALIATQQKYKDRGLNMFSYFDDTHAHLPCDVVNEFLSYFQVCLADLDLELNQGKSEIWLPSGTLDEGIAPEITKRDQGGIEVCGTPVGTPAFIRAKR